MADEEEYEPDDVNESVQEEDEYDDMPETSSYFNSTFARPDLQNAHRLRSTPFKEEAKRYIENGNLYPRAQRALSAFIDQNLSEMSILSNYQNENSALLDFDIAMIKMVPNYYPSDRKNPLLSHIEELLRGHIKSIFTRATGGDRERLLNMKQTVETRQVKMDDIGKIKVNGPKQSKSLHDGVF